MNRYGTMARSHWARWLPQQYAAISDPDSFFSAIGQEAARQIDELTTELAGDGQPGEDYLARAGRLAAARSQAEEIVLPQQVLPPPEPGASQDPQENDPPPASYELKLEASMRPERMRSGEPRAGAGRCPWLCCFNAARAHALWRTTAILPVPTSACSLQCGQSACALENLSVSLQPAKR